MSNGIDSSIEFIEFYEWLRLNADKKAMPASMAEKFPELPKKLDDDGNEIPVPAILYSAGEATVVDISNDDIMSAEIEQELYQTKYDDFDSK